MKKNVFYSYIILLFSLTSLFAASCHSNNEEPEVPSEIPLLEKTILQVSVSSENLSVKLPLCGTVDCVVEWGDYTSEDVDSSYPTHTYTVAGSYLVYISGTVTAMSTADFLADELNSIIGVVNWGNTGLTDMSMAFTGCSALTYLASDSEGHLAKVTSFYKAFEDCISLTEIPSGLFEYCSQATNFSYTFYNCTSLVSIPSGLFKGCTEADNFASAFQNCIALVTIPNGLFDSCAYASTFASTFQDCKALMAIPQGLFDYCTEVSNFSSTFQLCTSLTEIPTGLFDNCLAVRDFVMAFSGCSQLEGESPYNTINGEKVHLYERESNDGFVTPVGYLCFSGCTKLSDYGYIPGYWGR